MASKKRIRLRRQRRLKRRASIAERKLTQTEQLMNNALAYADQLVSSHIHQKFVVQTTLLAVLAQQGGEVEITKGTLEQARDDKSLDWEFGVKSGEPDVLVVKLLQGQSGDSSEQWPPQSAEPGQPSMDAEVEAKLAVTGE